MNDKEIIEKAKKETQEYIYHIGKRIHKLQILAQKCYDAVKKFNEEIEDLSSSQPHLIAINHNLRMKIVFTGAKDPELEKQPKLL